MQAAGRAVPATRGFPKLYNAHRRIEVSRGLNRAQLAFFKKNPLSENWRKQVSQDVVDFVNKVERDAGGKLTNELLPQEKIRLFENPAKYFSRPHNVPNVARKQVHFPTFPVTLLRTPHLGPRYAQFKVPLSFSKLDLKSYLKNLYNVEVSHVRSFVVHMKHSRKPASNRFTRGQKTQPRFRKKMTAELVEPFVWPAETTEKELNSRDYDKETFWKSTRVQTETAEKEQALFPDKPDDKHRESMAEQAKALLSGKAVWKPTWQGIPSDLRILQRRSPRLPPPSSSSTSDSPFPLR